MDTCVEWDGSSARTRPSGKPPLIAINAATPSIEEPPERPSPDNCLLATELDEQTLGANVEDVKANFIALLKFNRIQYLCLSALLYSVICIAISVHYVSSREPPVSGDEDTSTLCIKNWSQRQLNRLLLIGLIASTLLLTVTTLLMTLQFGKASPPEQSVAKSSSGKSTTIGDPQVFGRLGSSGWLEAVGLFLAAQNLCLPSLISLLVCKSDSGPLLAPQMALVYLLPQLLEGAGYCRLPIMLLVTSSTCLSAYQTRDHVKLTLLTVGCTLALLFGLQRQIRLKKSIKRSTFRGANQLVEAKVSLEHQRQQQETLLLSVLPAYVAEQVKRNMLKKSARATTPTHQNPIPNVMLHQPSPQCTLSRSVEPTEAQPVAVFPRAASPQSDSLTPLSDSRPISPIGRRNSSMPTHPDQPTNALTPSGMNSNRATSFTQPTSSNNQLSGPAVQLAASGQARRGFNELYIRTYNNVSLLYGDIVGFTRLCTQLSSSQLVRVLNDLFSQFDLLAERHKIMRIKILGDCYYGVSGIPEFAVMGAKSRAGCRQDNHAVNCVNMGLDMIHYIRRLNVERASSCSRHSNKQPVASSQASSFETTDETSTVSQSSGQTLPAFELNMRIGIHSGHIHSGVIGLKKWQFDVWSNDVSIAMHCESAGIAGRVHVTEATLQQLQGAFAYEPAQGAQRDQFLATHDIHTFLIKDQTPSLQELCVEPKPVAYTRSKGLGSTAPGGSQKSKRQRRRQSTDGADKIAGNQAPLKNKSPQTKSSATLDSEGNIRAATIGTIRQTLLAGDTFNSNGTNSYGLAFNHHDMTSIGLTYRDQSLTKLYLKRPIDEQPQELASLLLILGFMLLLVNFKLPVMTPNQFQILLVLIGLAGLLLTVSLLQVCGLKASASPTNIKIDLAAASDLPSEFPRTFNITKSLSQEVDRSWMGRLSNRWSKVRAFIGNKCQDCARSLATDRRCNRLRSSITLWIFFAVIFFQCYVNLRGHRCLQTAADGQINEHEFQQLQLTVIILLMGLDATKNLLSHGTKCLGVLAVILLQLAFGLPFWSIGNLLCSWYGHLEDQAMQDRCLSAALLFFVGLWSLAQARQNEYISKTNFLWRNRLNVDHEELEYISGINKLLLENILPSHVVQYYLSHPSEKPNRTGNPWLTNQPYIRMSFSNMRCLSNELYHEQHDSVAVMFASIPHFYEFYDESDISKQGLGCIALLNEIICDFDKLLLKNKFSRIEKIKTIGSTYMAAAGLRPCNLNNSRNSTVSQLSMSFTGSHREVSPIQQCSTASAFFNQDFGDESRRLAASQQRLNLICMIQFATSLMSALNGINKQSFQVFKLRIGVNSGSVIAGVVGAQRPFYDIWGDCVNIASRMESLGKVDRIQVEERTAKLLRESLCPEAYSIVCRGPIEVKGKGGMVTYFVDKKTAKEDYQQKPSSSRRRASLVVQSRPSIGSSDKSDTSGSIGAKRLD